jgi:cyclohexanone monooxygenase
VLEPGQADLICDNWTELNRNIAARLGEMGNPELSVDEYMALREETDYGVMERLRARVDEVVADPKTAEKLKPYYRFLCKRPCFSDDYLPTFNRPNVTLVDVSASRGVDRITEKGVVANGEEYEVDCIVFASGFEITTSFERRFGIGAIEGAAGKSLYDHWADGYRTFHGMTAHGFPNMLFMGFTQTGVSVNVSDMYEQQSDHLAYLVKEALDRGVTRLEPTSQAEQGWIDHMRATEISNRNFLLECTPGYYNNEGGTDLRSHLGEVYGPGFYAFGDLMDEWRKAGDMAGLDLQG